MIVEHRDAPQLVPRKGESFNGLVARWAEQNWVDRMIDVTSDAGIGNAQRPSAAFASKEALAALADAMGIDAEHLVCRATQWVEAADGRKGLVSHDGLDIPSCLVERTRRRFAPAALAIDPYHRILWDLKILPCDVETGQMLIYQCRSASCEGRAVGWRHTLGIDRCEHCMADLSNETAEDIAEHLLAPLRDIAKLFRREERGGLLQDLPVNVAAHGGQVAFDLLLALIPVADPSLSNLMRCLQRVPPVQLADALVGAWKLVIDWPISFESMLVRHLNSRTTRHSDGNQGHTVKFLRSHECGAASPHVSRLVRELRNEYELVGNRAHKVRARTLTVKQASKALGFKTTEVSRLRRAGVLKVRPTICGKGRLQPTFDRDEIFAMRGGIVNRMGLDAMSAVLGVSVNGCEQMVQADHVELLAHPFFLERYGAHQIERASFEALLGRLDRRAQPSLTDRTLPLSNACKVIGGRPKPWAAIFAALIEGSLAFRIDAGKAPLAKRLKIRWNDVNAIARLENADPVVGLAHRETAMSKQDAMEFLNVGPVEVTELFAHVPNSGLGRNRAISIDDVLALAGTNITSAELALRRGVGVQRAYLDAIAHPVERLGAAGFCRRTAEEAFLD